MELERGGLESVNKGYFEGLFNARMSFVSNCLYIPKFIFLVCSVINTVPAP
jgi:hypothetical protein